MIIGMDVHPKTSAICEMSADGEVLDKYSIQTSYTGLKKLIRKAPKGSRVVLESTTVAKPIYRHLKRNGLEVHVANPRGVKALSPTSNTDEKSAETLANLLRASLLPESYVPTPEEDELRAITRLRIDLGQKSVEIKNQIHALLKSNLVGYEQSDLFGKTGLEYLRHVELTKASKLALDSYLRQLGQLKDEMAKMDLEMARIASENPAAKLLMTIPGIDYYSALIIISEIGDIKRFPDARRLSAYAGLVPRVHQSGETARIGRITKTGPAHLRHILVINAHTVVMREGKLKRFYTRLAKKKGAQKAIVATAHKLLIIIYHLLTKNQPYEERNDELFERKIRRMEFKAKRAAAADASAKNTIIDEPLVAAGIAAITEDAEASAANGIAGGALGGGSARPLGRRRRK